jgi:hypothetical protein
MDITKLLQTAAAKDREECASRPVSQEAKAEFTNRLRRFRELITAGIDVDLAAELSRGNSPIIIGAIDPEKRRYIR